MGERVLCVDDDPTILDVYRRQLQDSFPVDLAPGPEQGLARVAGSGPYAVVLSDMRMPRMSGAQFLGRVRAVAPDTVRIMVTGYATQATAIEAVNDGHVFLFLTKPCTQVDLIKAVAAGMQHYRLATAEKDLLEKTLHGVIKVLTEVLSLVNPTAFGRAYRVRHIVHQLAAELKVDRVWELEVAAMLSHIGCVTVPEDLLRTAYVGAALTLEESRMLERHSQTGGELIAKIPRLENVARIIADQDKHFDGSGYPRDDRTAAAIPLGARILKVALDFDGLKAKELSGGEALRQLRQHVGAYDPVVVDALEKVLRAEARFEVRWLAPEELACDMILDENLANANGLLLIRRGQEISATLVQRLRNCARQGLIGDKIRVLVPSVAPARSAGLEQHG